VQYASFREEIRNEMIAVRLREREVDSKLVISEGEIDNYLANQAAPAAARNTSWRTSCCARRNRPVPEQLQKLRQRGEQALKRAQAGENLPN
jgi:peptidyl-prolyl cis-trans isomerase SurA